MLNGVAQTVMNPSVRQAGVQASGNPEDLNRPGERWDVNQWLSGKESTCNAGDLGSMSGSGRFPGEGNSNPLQYSCPENPHGQRSLAGYSSWVRKSQTRLSD